MPCIARTVICLLFSFLCCPARAEQQLPQPFAPRGSMCGLGPCPWSDDVGGHIRGAFLLQSLDGDNRPLALGLDFALSFSLWERGEAGAAGTVLWNTRDVTQKERAAGQHTPYTLAAGPISLFARLGPLHPAGLDLAAWLQWDVARAPLDGAGPLYESTGTLGAILGIEKGPFQAHAGAAYQAAGPFSGPATYHGAQGSGGLWFSFGGTQLGVEAIGRVGRADDTLRSSVVITGGL